MSIEQELLSLLRLHHKHLIHYQAIKYQQTLGRITVYVSNHYVLQMGNQALSFKECDHFHSP